MGKLENYATSSYVGEQVRRLSQSPYFNVMNYGAVGDGVTDDAAAINAAIAAASAAGGGVVWFPAKTFAIGASGIVGNSNIDLLGESKTKTVIKSIASPTDKFIAFTDETYFSVINLTIDVNNVPNDTGNKAALHINRCDDFVVRDVIVKKIHKFGIMIGGSERFTVESSYFEFDVAISTTHSALHINSTSGTCSDGLVLNNTFVRCNVYIDANDITIANNIIKDHTYGAAIAAGFGTDTRNVRVKIIGNHIYGGVGLDSDATWSLGIECWARYSIIMGNHIHDMAGVGMDIGGKHSLIVGNHIYLVSVSTLHAPYYAITARYYDADVNANYCTFVGNVGYDTQTTKTQSHFYGEQSASLEGIRLFGNYGSGLTGVYDIKSSSTIVDGALEQASATFNPSNLADGAGETTTVSVPGAAVGDYAVASFSNDLQGITLTAWVSAANTVSVRFQNESGGALDLASGTLRVRVFPQTQ